MLVGKLSLRRWPLRRALWYLWTHVHRVHDRRRGLLLVQFGDRREDRRPTGTRSVRVVPRSRVLADNVDNLSAVLERRSRRTTALTFRSLLRLRALTHKFRFRDGVVLLPRERLWGWLRQCRQTLDRIRVPMIGSLYITLWFGISRSHIPPTRLTRWYHMQAASMSLDPPTPTSL